MKNALVGRVALVVLLAFLLASAGGCWNPFAPDGGGGGGGGGDEQYKERTSIENVLHNLETSYRYMNAEEYLDCFAEDFTFWLNPQDIVEDPSLPIYWGKPTEVSVANNMFADDSDVGSVELELLDYGSPVELPAPDPNDPSMWQWNEQVDLWVNLEDIDNTQLHANAGASFIFRQDPDDTGPNGEILWEVYEWYDVDKWVGKAIVGDDPEVVMTVGQLKAMYQ